MIAPKEKPAFTLIELLIVITIIGVLTGFLVMDFTGAKQRQELSTLADQALALLQQTQAEVAAGKVGEDELLCEGAYFEVDGGFQMVTDEGCDSTDVMLENYGILTGEAKVSEIMVGSDSLDDVYVMYIPPEGDVEFNSGANDGDAEITFVHPSLEDSEIVLTINSTTNKVALSNEE